MLTQEIDGLLWPHLDRHCHTVAKMELGNLARVVNRCKKRDAVVQAGGNVGVFAKFLAKEFAQVYTFEPDQENFFCLTANVTEPNVIKLQAALGFWRKQVELIRAPNNAGAHAVGSLGNIPILRIDDLALEACDLIYLDIEGYELEALQGALWTIQKCNPVIAFEDKGLSEQYGVKQGACQKYLEQQMNYRVIEQVGNDVVCVPPTLMGA